MIITLYIYIYTVIMIQINMFLCRTRKDPPLTRAPLPLKAPQVLKTLFKRIYIYIYITKTLKTLTAF